MSEDEDPFVKEVLSHSKRVLLESKRLVDLVNNMVSEEEDISAPARDTALATFELLDYVTREIVTHRGKQREGLGGQALLAACKDVRSAVLDLVQAARSVFSNPFDFLCKQTLDNCRNSVVNSIKGVIQAAESLQQETIGNNNNNKNEKSGDAGNFDVVQDMKNANKALQAIFSCSRAPVPQDVFVQSAKGLLDTINQLMFISKSLNLSLEDRLKEDTTGVINAAKHILRDFEDKTFHARFQEAIKVLQASLKTFLFACAKSKDGKVLDNSSSNGLRPRSEILGAPRGMEADSHSFVLTPPRPASAPPPSLSPSPPSASVPQPPSYSNSTATAPVELMARPSPLTRLNSTDLKSSIDSRAKKIVQELTSVLLVSFPQFKGEWNNLTLDVKNSLTVRMEGQVARELTGFSQEGQFNTGNGGNTGLDESGSLSSSAIMLGPLGQGSQGQGNFRPRSMLLGPHGSLGVERAGEESEDADAMEELKKIMKLKNTADWGMMSMSLKSLSRRFSRKERGDIQEVQFQEDVPVADIPHKLKELCASIGEATMDILIYVNAISMSLQRELTETGKEASANLESSVNNMFYILKTTIALTAKWRTESEEEAVKSNPIKKSLPRPPNSPEEERQRAHKQLVHKMLDNTVKATNSAPRKGTHIEKILGALNSSSSNNAHYVKLKLEESLDTKIYSESTAIRALAAQVMSAINATLAEQFTEIFGNVLQLNASVKSLVSTIGRLLDAIETLKYISCTVTSTPGDSKLSSSMLEEEDKDVDIWGDHTELILGDQQTVKAGTLNGIITRLTSDMQYDTKFLSTFITTYQSFTTPWKVLEKLLQRYNSKGKIDEKRVPPIQLRVCVVLKYWIENQCADFDSTLIKALNTFFADTLMKDGHVELAKQLTKQLSTKVEELSVKKKAMTADPFSALQVQEKLSPADLFIALNESEIARQFTLIDFALFKKIQPSELFNQSWNKPKLHHRAPHILAMISRANHLSFWVGSFILWATSLKERTLMLTKFIKIGKHLRDLNNFNTLMGVVAGINMSAISRLRSTFNEVNKNDKTVLDGLQLLLNPSSSFKNYRQVLRNANPPCLPYLGSYLTDLTFMEDGNPDNVTHNGVTMINYYKRELVYNTLREIHMYQQSSYNFPIVEPIHTFLTALPFSEEKDLYELSLQREPRQSS